jgi:hypothetical protein
MGLPRLIVKKPTEYQEGAAEVSNNYTREDRVSGEPTDIVEQDRQEEYEACSDYFLSSNVAGPLMTAGHGEWVEAPLIYRKFGIDNVSPYNYG